ncbi:hypothetical protein BLNAU_862 [Blattamonas nauphoetae]|uniref:Uncharacterized protein n=1 Tax=Blattamonas nauphoetae TaxID=2049346 RepID=A0ABQ9YKP9_9EUKA|nr:hypothetical protein BLNAU_862 [Blattamonas nauphoetae]
MSINVPGLNIRSQLLSKDDLHINHGIPTDQSLPVILNHAIAKLLSPPMTPEIPYSMLRIRTQLAPEPEFPAPSPSFSDDPEMDCTMLLDALSFPFLSTSSNCVKRALPTSHTPLFCLKTNIRDICLFERVKVLVRPVSIILDGENAKPPGYSLTVVEFLEHRLESNVEIVPLTKQQLPGIPMKQRDQKPH